MWNSPLIAWLVQSTVSCAVILAVGSIAVRFCRQPVYRIGIIRWTFAACLLVPLLRQSDLLPLLPLRVLPIAESVPEINSRSESVEQDGIPLAMSGREYGAERTVSSRSALDTAKNESLSAKASSHKQTRHVESTVASSFPVWHWSLGLWLAYGSVLMGVAVYWIAGVMHRRRIERSSLPASLELREILASIAGDEAAAKVRLLTSDQLDSPVMWGLWRPTIVVPSRLANACHSSELRYGLAHEWSHVQRGDFATHAFAGFLKLVCFQQPLYWFLRKQLVLCQDYLADAFAAGQGSQSEDYAEFLVALARRRNSTKLIRLSSVLGVCDRQSQLLKRVRMIVSCETPLLQRQAGSHAMLISFATALLVVTLGAVRLSAQPADKPAPRPVVAQQANAVEDKSALPAAITYTGQVVDRDTGKPIVGAVVEIRRSLNVDPVTHEWKDIETTKHTSDESGKYSFTLPPEQVAQRSLYLEVSAAHPDYQPKGRGGYSHSMILKNIELGEPPFYSTIKLSKGEPVFGTVLTPDGTPAKGLRVIAYTSPSAKKLDWARLAVQYSTSSEPGMFRIVCTTPGDGVIWFYTDNFSPMAVRIGDRRGDLGSFRLEEGTRISGKVLNAQGEPVSSVAVELRRDGDGEEVDELLGQIANGIRATAMTDADGRFQMTPLPPGKYRATIEDEYSIPGSDGGRPQKLKIEDVFVPMEITLAEGEIPDPIEIQAVPHVIVRGRFFDSSGKPRASHEQYLVGKVNGAFVFSTSTRPGSDGWFEFKVPHGMEEVELQFMTNEHSALRWRLRPDEPLQRGRYAKLGKLDEDCTTLEIVRYKASILLVKAVDEAGNQVQDFTLDSSYKPNGVTDGRRFVYGGDVNFESQSDGRKRSSQLVPDEELTVTIEKEGFTSEPQTVSLKEGETRELVCVLKPVVNPATAPAEKPETEKQTD